MLQKEIKYSTLSVFYKIVGRFPTGDKVFLLGDG
jgi:hypothetical protein